MMALLCKQALHGHHLRLPRQADHDLLETSMAKTSLSVDAADLTHRITRTSVPG